MKKIMTVLCFMFLGIHAPAVVGKSKILQLESLATASRYQSWALGKAGQDVYKITSNGTAFILIYVNSYIGYSSRQSDPVRVVCGGQPQIVNPGQVTACKVTPFSPACWKIEPDFVVNGSEGIVFYAE